MKLFPIVRASRGAYPLLRRGKVKAIQRLFIAKGNHVHITPGDRYSMDLGGNQVLDIPAVVLRCGGSPAVVFTPVDIQLSSSLDSSQLQITFLESR